MRRCTRRQRRGLDPRRRGIACTEPRVFHSGTFLKAMPNGAYTTMRTVGGATLVFDLSAHVARIRNSYEQLAPAPKNVPTEQVVADILPSVRAAVGALIKHGAGIDTGHALSGGSERDKEKKKKKKKRKKKKKTGHLARDLQSWAFISLIVLINTPTSPIPRLSDHSHQRESRITVLVPTEAGSWPGADDDASAADACAIPGLPPFVPPRPSQPGEVWVLAEWLPAPTFAAPQSGSDGAEQFCAQAFRFCFISPQQGLVWFDIIFFFFALFCFGFGSLIPRRTNLLKMNTPLHFFYSPKNPHHCADPSPSHT
jgi:hypothetical protein